MSGLILFGTWTPLKQDVSQSEECEEEDSRTEVSSEASRINEELQDVLQKLINEPDLLQDLVNSLMEPNAEG